MKQNVFFLQLLTILFVASGIRGCGRNVEPVPDLTLSNESIKQLDELDKKGELPSLGKLWEGHLKLLAPKEDQQKRFQKAVLSFDEKARKDLLSIVSTVPMGRPRLEFLEDLSAFNPKEIEILVNIIIDFYRKEKKAMSDIFENRKKASLRNKLRFLGLKRKLSTPNKALVDRFLKELAIPNS